MIFSSLFASASSGETKLSLSMWELIWASGPVVKGVLLILILFSIISWIIIFLKSLQFKKTDEDSKNYLLEFFKCSTLDSMFELSKKFSDSPESAIFISSYKEMQRLAKKHPDEGFNIEDIERAMNKSQLDENEKISSSIPFLATTASASPFIGLFGTVWGIMNSFQAIGIKGSANLATVAPGISEALIATAIGLGAAIPAVIFYNLFLNKQNKIFARMKGFKTDLLNIIKRNF
jgi:biopolymer transport protein TolQ